MNIEVFWLIADGRIILFYVASRTGHRVPPFPKRAAQYPDTSPEKSAPPRRKSIGNTRMYSPGRSALTGLKKERADLRKNRERAAGTTAQSGSAKAAAPV